MSTAEKISALKLILGEKLVTSTTKEFWRAPHFPSGIPKGAIVELLGEQKVEWVIQFLVSHPEIKIFWAEKEQSLLPTAIRQRGLRLDRVTFGTFGEQMVAPLRRIIQSQSFQVVLAPNLFSEIKIFQALQIFTEKANSTLFLLAQDQASTAWPISLQLEIKKGEGQDFEIEILRQKQGQLR